MFFFFAVCRYSITDEGRKLAERLETVTGDSLSSVSTDATAPFTSDSVKSPSHASIDLTSDKNLDSNYLSAADASRNFKPCIEKVSSSHDRFTRITDRFTRITERDEEFKPARYGLGKWNKLLAVSLQLLQSLLGNYFSINILNFHSDSELLNEIPNLLFPKHMSTASGLLKACDSDNAEITSGLHGL